MRRPRPYSRARPLRLRRAADEAMALEGAHIEPRFGAPIVNPPDDLDCDDRPGVSSRTIRDID